MIYKVTTFLADEEVKSEDLKIQNISVYGILNKYLRAKDNEFNKLEKSVS